MHEIRFYLLKFFKISFLQLRVNEVVVFKIVNSFLNLFKTDDPINKMLF